MKYYVSKSIQSDEDPLEIKKSEYDSILLGYKNISQSIFLEEKFDLLLSNYYEYEKDLLDTAWYSLLFNDVRQDRLTENRNLITRRIINLLSTSNMYVEQCNSHVGEIFNQDIKVLEDLKQFISKQFDTYLGYRVCYKLRNFSMHFDLPSNLITNSFRNDEQDDGKTYIKSITIPGITLSFLKRDSNFSNKVIQELESEFGEIIDIRPLLREYILGITKINDYIRDLISKDFKSWFQSIEIFLRRVIKESDNEINLYIFKQENDGKYIPRLISWEFLNRRTFYINKNNIDDNFLLYYSSNQIRKNDVKKIKAR